MPNITFQPVLRDIKDVLNSDFYVIPRFQRPYSWSSENLDDFWRDVVLDNDEGYFHRTDGCLRGVLGPARHGGWAAAHNIHHPCTLCTEGQFQTLQASAYASGLAKYIERLDDDSVSHFVLRSALLGRISKHRSSYLFPGPMPKLKVKSRRH